MYIVMGLFIVTFVALFILKLVSSSIWREAFEAAKNDTELSKRLSEYKNGLRSVNIKAVNVGNKEFSSLPINIQAILLRKKKVDHVFLILFLLAMVLLIVMIALG